MTGEARQSPPPAGFTFQAASSKKTRCPDVEMFARNSVIVTRSRVPPVFGPRGSRSSSLSVIIITDCAWYTVVDCRRPNSSGRRCLCLERTTTLHLDCPCEFSAVVSRLIFHVFLSRLYAGACEVTCVIRGQTL